MIAKVRVLSRPATNGPLIVQRICGALTEQFNQASSVKVEGTMEILSRILEVYVEANNLHGNLQDFGLGGE